MKYGSKGQINNINKYYVAMPSDNCQLDIIDRTSCAYSSLWVFAIS